MNIKFDDDDDDYLYQSIWNIILESDTTSGCAVLLNSGTLNKPHPHTTPNFLHLHHLHSFPMQIIPHHHIKQHHQYPCTERAMSPQTVQFIEPFWMFVWGTKMGLFKNQWQDRKSLIQSTYHNRTKYKNNGTYIRRDIRF